MDKRKLKRYGKLHKTYTDFNTAYTAALIDLVHLPEYMLNNTREITNYSFVIEDVTNPIPFRRDISLSYALGELVWYWSGSPIKDFIAKFGSMWDRISDDGFTSNSAYGYAIRSKYGFNQIEKVIKLLKRNPEERRAVININVPNPNVDITKDEPCTIALQFLVRNNKLHMTTYMRSNDVWFGTPYDVIYFISIQQYIAKELNVGLGEYTHHATSFHVYNRDMDKLTKALKRDNVKVKPKIDLLRIAYEATKYYKLVNEMKDPKKEIIELFEKEGILTYEDSDS